jgi:hypothetical protein
MKMVVMKIILLLVVVVVMVITIPVMVVLVVTTLVVFPTLGLSAACLHALAVCLPPTLTHCTRAWRNNNNSFSAAFLNGYISPVITKPILGR